MDGSFVLMETDENDEKTEDGMAAPQWGKQRGQEVSRMSIDLDVG